MAAQKTITDEILEKIKNNKFIAIFIVITVVVGAIASFFGSIQNLITFKNKVFPTDKVSEQKTKIFSPPIDDKKQDFEKYFNSNFDLADYNSEVISITRDKLIINLSISNPNDTYKYKIKKEGGLIKINPQNTYLSLLKKGGPIFPKHYWHSPFEGDFAFPNFDIKIVNNTEETISFLKGIFNIHESKTDPFPILWINGDGYNMQLPLINVGWGKVYNAIIKFNLFPIEESREVYMNYSHEIVLGDFDRYSEKTDLTPIFRKLGVDVEAINGFPYDDDKSEKSVKALGIFKSATAKVIGEIEYWGLNSSGQKSREILKFKAVVHLGMRPPGLPMPPRAYYDVKFETDGSDYQKELPPIFMHVIKPGEADRFQFKISAAKSSRHVFDFVLLYNDNKTISFENIGLNYFMTPLDAKHIAEKPQGTVDDK